jgi:RNA polymerase sigma-70 factor (ECF subfamily)
VEETGTNWRERAIRDAVLAGDAAAWRAWYDEHFDRLFAYVRWRCGGRADLADDVIQDAWLAAVRRLRTFDPDRGSFYAWLCGIAANAMRNALRSWKRHAKHNRPLDPLADAPASVPDAAAAEKDERVAIALAELPEHYEAVLRAKYLDRMTVEAIATARSDSVKAVESLLARARQAFREAYEKTSHD